MKWTDLDTENCPIAESLSLIGEKWTLLIIRDCFMGVTRFDDFQRHLQVTRHILSDRLKKLEQHGLVEKRPYMERPKRYDYCLTEKGNSLQPLLILLRDWGQKHMVTQGCDNFDFYIKGQDRPIEPQLIDAGSKEEITLRTVEIRITETQKEAS